MICFYYVGVRTSTAGLISGSNMNLYFSIFCWNSMKKKTQQLKQNNEFVMICPLTNRLISVTLLIYSLIKSREFIR